MGIGAVIPHVEASVGGRWIGEYQWRGPGYQVFGGFSYGLSRHWSVLGEYKYSRTRITVVVPGGDAATLLSTQHLVFGGGYRL